MLPPGYFQSAQMVTEYMMQLMHPALTHHHFTLAYHTCLLEDVRQSNAENWNQLTKSQAWSQTMFELISANQRDSAQSQAYLTSSVTAIREQLPLYVLSRIEAY